jgi:hypothetical protein
MKYLKESGLEITKWSEMDGWSKPEIYDELGENLPDELKVSVTKVLDALYENGLTILSINKGEFFKSRGSSNRETYGTFQSEKELAEYRVTLGRVVTTDRVLDNWGATTVEEFDKGDYADNEGYREEFLSDLKDVGKVEEIHDNSLEFSVFAPHAKMGPELKSLIIVNALKYLSMLILNAKESVIFGKLNYHDMLFYEMDDTKNIFKAMDEKVSVDNMEVIPDICYRLYKDNKFFRELSDYKGGDESMKSMLLDIYETFKK